MKNETLILVLVIIALGFNAWILREVRAVKKDLKSSHQVTTAAIQQLQKARPAGRGGEGQAAPQPTEVRVSIDDDPIKGDPKAPVTIVEFSDYQCPFCRKFHDNTLPSILNDYINKGKVRYIFRDYPLGFHAKAIPAAVAANCAGEQGKYWELNEFLFGNPDKLDIPAILASTKELGLNHQKFEACVNAKDKQEAEINKDFEEGQKYGVRGTPSFFIGKTEDGKEMTGFYIRGAQQYPAFKAQIDKLLGQGG